MTIYVNGRFLTQPLGGVQRFCREIVCAIDARLSAAVSDDGGQPWVLLAPFGVTCDLRLSRITFRAAGSAKGHVWEQTQLYRAARDGVLVNLGNSGPLLHPRSVAVLHDALVYKVPQNFSLTYRMLHQTMGRLLSKRARLGTVSRFSQGELAEMLHLDSARLFLAPNGCEHIGAITPDRSVLARLGLTKNRYFLQVGTPTPNKNVARAVDAFAALRPSGVQFVMVGSANQNVFSLAQTESVTGLVSAGRLTDAELATLYQDCLGLVFPSVYEGFGIPPLEAMVHGAPVLAAQIPPVEEVCGDAALYFDPLSVQSIRDAMARFIAEPGLRDALRAEGRARSRLFTWDRSARTLMEEVGRLA